MKRMVVKPIKVTVDITLRLCWLSSCGYCVLLDIAMTDFSTIYNKRLTIKDLISSSNEFPIYFFYVDYFCI